MELVTDPKLLLCDEVTSGLDPDPNAISCADSTSSHAAMAAS
ncbi:hypothetical protein [Rubritalea tangerina]